MQDHVTFQSVTSKKIWLLMSDLVFGHTFFTLFRWYFIVSFALASALISPMIPMASEKSVGPWQEMRRGEVFAIMRHAIAPGTGDPAAFTLEECSTQRNLSDLGRSQAVAIGDMFRDNGILKARVLSSQWCRCLETARLLNLGEVKELPALNSFFRDFQQGEPQTEKLKTWLARQDHTLPLILVTHQVNITALTGLFPASGEIFFIKKTGQDEFEVVARLLID